MELASAAILHGIVDLTHLQQGWDPGLDYGTLLQGIGVQGAEIYVDLSLLGTGDPMGDTSDYRVRSQLQLAF